MPNLDETTQLFDSWMLHLRAERKSVNTLKSYGDGVRAFLGWCAETGVDPVLDRPTVNAFTAALIDAGLEGTTARSRQLAVRRFSAWLADEEEIPRDELIGIKPPKVDTKVIPELTGEEAKALIAACKGKTFRDKRDEAIVRFMLETMSRAGEVIGMRLDETDLKTGSAVIRRGKGGKGRRVPFGPLTGAAIDRYVRMRKPHKLAARSQLWLGDRNRDFTYWALYYALKRRAEQAGLGDFHPHVLRHTGAGRWLDAGGTEGGLMAVAGWSRREMIDRYTRATSERRAAEEAKRLNLGDL
jgi:site-specific recombinase XerD